MDPIAHTLTGATLAQTGLRRTTPLATATLIIGANIPDIDAVFTFVGQDASLLYRRGLTHGIAALVVLPLLLTVLVYAYDRWFRRRRAPDKSPVKLPAVLGLSFLGVLSHFFLDWLNTYGVRLLMPFDDRWFYGDTLFIVDPWLWLLLGASVVFAHSRSRLSQGAWLVVGALASALVTLAPMVPGPAVAVWWIGVAVIALARWRGVDADENRRVAVACVTAVCLYLAAMMAGNKVAQDVVTDELGDDVRTAQIMTGPLPANPFSREIVAETDRHYHGLTINLFDEPQVEERFAPQPIEEPEGVVAAALDDESVQGFVNWMRFPVFEVQNIDDGHRVIIRDLRYVEPDVEESPGIGMTTVDIPEAR